MADKIGSFNFVNLESPPHLVQQRLLTHSRPGTDGVTVHRVGTWGQPFTVKSLATAANITAAYQLYAGYTLLVGQAAVTVTWANIPLLGMNHRYYVLDVQPLRIATVLSGTGPSGAYGAECECQWALLPIKLA